MKVLAIETSSATASVAVADGDRLLEVRHFASPRGRGAELFAVLESLRPVWQGADRLALGLGPGSYNGLRAACALASSFELALGIELAVVPSPCLLGVEVGDFHVIGDARGGRTYFASVHDRQLTAEIELLDNANLAGRCQQAGSTPIFRVGPVPGAGPLPESHPEAGVLALLAPRLPAADPTTLEPIYLKPPHITTPRLRCP